MNTTIKTVLENGKDFFKEIEELIYKVSGLESELKNEKRLNFLQSEDVIRYGNELQKANETIKIQLERIQWLEKTNKTINETIGVQFSKICELRKEIEAGKAPIESDQLKMAKRLHHAAYKYSDWIGLTGDGVKHYMIMAEEALKGA